LGGHRDALEHLERAEALVQVADDDRSRFVHIRIRPRLIHDKCSPDGHTFAWWTQPSKAAFPWSRKPLKALKGSDPFFTEKGVRPLGTPLGTPSTLTAPTPAQAQSPPRFPAGSAAIRVRGSRGRDARTARPC